MKLDPLSLLEDLVELGFTLLRQGSASCYCLAQEPTFTVEIKRNKKGVLSYVYRVQKKRLTKEVWLDKLVERVYENKARVVAQALKGGY